MGSEIFSGKSRFKGLILLARRILLAVLLATSIDFIISVANGYRFRVEVADLIVLDALFLSIAIAPIIVLFHVTSFIPRLSSIVERVPRLVISMAICIPLAFMWIQRMDPMVGAMVWAAGMATLGAIALYDLKRGRLIQTVKWEGLIVGGALALIAVAVTARDLARKGPEDRVAESRSTSSAEAPNLLLIVLDTLRADHLGLYGYSKPESSK